MRSLSHNVSFLTYFLLFLLHSHLCAAAFFPVFFRRNTYHFFKKLIKIFCVFIPYKFTDFIYFVIFFPQKLFCSFNPFFHDIFRKRFSHIFFKQSAQIRRIQIQLQRDFFQRDLFIQIFNDDIFNIPDDFSFRTISFISQAVYTV